jgi:hypothetical protein
MTKSNKTHYINLNPRGMPILFSCCGKNDRKYKLKFTSRGKRVEVTCITCKRIENKND